MTDAGPDIAEQDVVALLAQVDNLLDAEATRNAPRLAAFLGRQAAETLITQRCCELVGPVPDATTKSKLAIIKSLDQTPRGQSLVLAWHRLSGYCHVHAYELSPTVGEVRGACRQVLDAVGEPGS